MCGAVPRHSLFTPTTRCRATASTCCKLRASVVNKRQQLTLPEQKQRVGEEELGKEEMGAASTLQCHFSLLLAFLLCSWFVHPSQAFKLHGGYNEEKVPLSFIVPDPTPVLSPLAAPPPVTGADDDDGMRPRLPTERWRRGRGEESRAGRGAEERHRAHAPALARSLTSPARAPASADAPAPDSGNGAPFIESSPAVPVPCGVRDTATILPMPAPGVKRQDVGRATLVRPGIVPMMVGFIMMASLGALC